MNSLTGLPSPAAKREMALAELRVERMRLQLLVAEIDCIGAAVSAGFVSADSVPLMLAELYGKAEGAADELP